MNAFIKLAITFIEKVAFFLNMVKGLLPGNKQSEFGSLMQDVQRVKDRLSKMATTAGMTVSTTEDDMSGNNCKASLQLAHLAYLCHKSGNTDDAVAFATAAFEAPGAPEAFELLADIASAQTTQTPATADLNYGDDSLILRAIKTLLKSRPRSQVDSLVSEVITILGCTPEAVVELWNKAINDGTIVKDGEIFRCKD